MLQNTSDSYGSVAKFFHWTIALLIIGLLAVGLYMEDLSDSPDKFKLYGLHKSTGIVVLTLATLRILWRWKNVLPQDPPMPRWQAVAARAVHYLLYFFMFAMPLSGWLMSSAGGHPVSLYGWIELPALVEKNKELGGIFRTVHGLGCWSIIILLVIHVGAALQHHFILKDNVLKRMLPFVR